MYKIIGITNRHLCQNDYLEQIGKIAALPLEAVILREKDLPEEKYETLAQEVMEICSQYGMKCIMHTYYEAARRLKCKYMHVPMHILRKYPGITDDFLQVGASTHSVEEALEAEKLGAAYITAGHIFETDCKKNLAPRGTGYLENVCKSVKIPVYAIGGITMENMESVIKCGAAGGCMMSAVMRCGNEWFKRD